MPPPPSDWRPPPPRKSSAARVAAIATVAILVLAGTLYFGVLRPGAPFAASPDFDRDGIPDSTDPDDDNDSMPDVWEVDNELDPMDDTDAAADGDSDLLQNRDEYALRSSPRDPDSDDDGPIDGRDVDPAVDLVVAFQYTRFRVEDPIDVGTEGDVYFTISMNDAVQLTSRVILFDTNAADVPADFTSVFNVPDDADSVHFRTTWMDKDLFFDDELDASGQGNAVDVDYSLVTHTWTGDTSGEVVSGDDDGSTGVDEDDVTLWFTIFDAANRPDEIEAVLAEMGSDAGLIDFSVSVRALGHLILDSFIQWALDHPDFFAEFGAWGSLVAAGLEILAIAVKFYRVYFLQNDDK